MTDLLEVKEVFKSYGGLTAVNGISMQVQRGKIQGIIGPNGAGKTTLFNVISGLEEANLGNVNFNGEDITNFSIVKIARKGLVRTFQRSLPFASMSVLENVIVGEYAFRSNSWGNLLSDWLRLGKADRSSREKAMDLLEFAGLINRADSLAGELPYGDQRRLEIARSLMTDPLALMLDEPAAGLSPEETDSVIELLNQLRSRGQTVIVIEHNLPVIMNLCDHVIVLDYGKKIAEGSPTEIQINQKVIEAYLGTRKAHARS